MDKYDKRIAFELMDNSRQTLRQLGHTVGLSASSVKKRIDQLIKTGFIQDFFVMLSNRFYQGYDAYIIVKTNGLVGQQDLLKHKPETDIVYGIVPMTSGEVLVRGIYSNPEELSDLVSKILSVDGVESVDVHTIDSFNGDVNASSLSTTDLRVLSQLALDARMPNHEIASRSDLSTKTVSRTIKRLVRNQLVHFGIKWNPYTKNSFVGLARVQYDPSETMPEKILGPLEESYPLNYWYSHISRNGPILFAVLDFAHITILEQITKSLRQQPGIVSVFVMIGYSAAAFDLPGRTMLIELLSAKGLWPHEVKH